MVHIVYFLNLVQIGLGGHTWILKELEYELLPTHEKILRPLKKILSPFKTRLIWILLLSVIAFFLVAYVLFIYVSLWIEDF
ncbi:hypothetical protein HPL003_06685 [Paenibacillus terrae HPL-003]|uniref:Uncharacterized protein n=1 Tax=Paenibacillus terrae (strain HPL-003) TaxID=985665 RepID=G7W3L3_PAETH|nr:hypothetical protein HPL003_06685 [Paenibacillus terrae HPL-003]